MPTARGELRIGIGDATVSAALNDASLAPRALESIPGGALSGPERHRAAPDPLREE